MIAGRRSSNRLQRKGTYWHKPLIPGLSEGRYGSSRHYFRWIVLLTYLMEGQQATVLQLPAAAVGSKAPQRAVYV